MKRELVPKGHPLRSASVAGLMVSIKLDGERAIWVPNTRGMVKEDVPFANNPSNWRARDTGHLTTGLWTQNGNIIHAPSFFLDKLPPFPVDMELYAGPNTFQLLRSIVSTFEPDPAAWELIFPCILDAVDMRKFLEPGIISTRNASIVLTEDALKWWYSFKAPAVPLQLSFKRRYEWLIAQGVTPVMHTQLPDKPLAAAELVEKMVDEVLAEGGEGLVLRQPHSLYNCARTRDLLKHKPLQDADAIVVGYYWGKEPDHRKSLTGTAVGERLGAMGGLLVQLENGKRFILSGTGFPYQDCHLVYKETGLCASDEGLSVPGSLASAAIHNPKYPLGSTVTFTYRAFTTGGIPVEARFKRRRM